jgi:hypothetical protein
MAIATLDGWCRRRARREHMNRILCSTLLVAAAALAGCDQSDHNLTASGPYDPEANATNAAAPVALPPSIAHSKIYRCKDNSLVYIDWLSDEKSANFKPERNAVPVQLTAPEAGQKMVAEGYSLTGTAADASVTLERPGKGSQVCKS